MGSNFAIELANGVGGLSIEQQVAVHLSANHYPPVPSSMVQPCLDAINAYWADELDRDISLPNGITWRDKNSAPAHAIIEAHHLWEWCQEPNEGE